MKSIFIAPHNDDECLFGAYTILKERPLVVIVTDGYIQGNRGDNITAEERILESKRAMNILGAEVEFLHIRDDELNEENLTEALLKYPTNVTVYAPDLEGGNPQHDLVSMVCSKLFYNIIYYKTYSKESVRTKGKLVEHTNTQKEIKEFALKCYKSQINHPWTRPYFETDNEEYYK